MLRLGPRKKNPDGRSVAERLGVSESTVRRLIRDGELPAGFVRGQLRVAEADLEAYMADTPGRARRPQQAA
ncbi:helix-turn-helix domain-containing protein [Micromonospora sp. NPDC050686]|uniref:helix-turn-helix domain-containing protein n=1 Tax=Micromonospora sp. NPDC050686 TaxID=3154631 RepID=UPI0033D3901A